MYKPLVVGRDSTIFDNPDGNEPLLERWQHEAAKQIGEATGQAGWTIEPGGFASNPDSIESLDRIWRYSTGLQSPYSLYLKTKRYERHYQKTTDEMLKEWRDGTLARSSRVNDWIYAKLQLDSYK